MKIIKTLAPLFLMVLLVIAFADASAEIGEKSGRDITVQDGWTYEPLPTNEKYNTLTFRFTCEEDPTVYEACVAGITLEPVYGDAGDGMDALMLAMADSFYASEKLTLTSNETFTEEYQLQFQTIDAEKVHVYEEQGEKSDPALPDTDSMLCWAGSASNMLAFSGWGAASGQEGLDSEDELFALFEHGFTDAGSKQTAGAKWFFNGVFPEQ